MPTGESGDRSRRGARRAARTIAVAIALPATGYLFAVANVRSSWRWARNSARGMLPVPAVCVSS